MRHTRTSGLIAALATLGAATMGLAACGSSDDPVAGSSTAAGSSAGSTGPIIIGSANFQENVLLAEIYAGALKAKGVEVSTKLNIGNRETYIPGLKDGSIDLIPEYNGVLLQYFDKKATAVSSSDVYAALTKVLPENLIVLAQSQAQDKDAIVVTKATAAKYNLTSIADLKPVAGQLTLGGAPEFKTRPDGVPGLAALYGVTFGTYKSLDAGGPLTINALKNGQIDAGDVFTTDPSIPTESFVVLEDPKNLFAAQNVVPLINKAKATDTVRSALDAVSAKLDTPTLTALDKLVIADKKDPKAVAAEWLTSNGLG